MFSNELTKELLLRQILGLLNDQEKRFGKNTQSTARSTPPAMRLPIRWFLDFRSGGSLCHICLSSFLQMSDGKHFGFFSWEKYNEKIKLLLERRIWNAMIQKKFFRFPVAYIRPEIPKDLREQIANILKERQCEIIQDESQASHIIYPEIESIASDYARPSLKSGENVQIHWYYLPESYDLWVPNTFALPVRVFV